MLPAAWQRPAHWEQAAVAPQQRQGINRPNQSYLRSAQIPGATVTTEEEERLQRSLTPQSWQREASDVDPGGKWGGAAERRKGKYSL